MARNPILGFALAAGLITGLLTGPAAQPIRAQQGQRLKAWQERRVSQKEARGQGRGQVNPRGLAGLPPKWVANLREMPPEEQERFMHNNERFQTLPPQRQAQIRQNLAKWNQMTPEQKNRIRATEQMFEQMSSAQRERFRDEIIPKLAQLPPDRRQRVIGHWRRLQAMTTEQQQAALRDPRFMPGLSPDEQALVRDLNSMGAPPPQESAHPPAQ